MILKYNELFLFKIKEIKAILLIFYNNLLTKIKMN
jgi:hypothetical protein